MRVVARIERRGLLEESLRAIQLPIKEKLDADEIPQVGVVWIGGRLLSELLNVSRLGGVVAAIELCEPEILLWPPGVDFDGTFVRLGGRFVTGQRDLGLPLAEVSLSQVRR